MKALKFKTAPLIIAKTTDEKDEIVGGYEDVVISTELIIGFEPVSDGPNGMKRTKILTNKGGPYFGLGSVERLAKAVFDDIREVLPEEETHTGD